jgi:hypothetical protein
MRIFRTFLFLNLIFLSTNLFSQSVVVSSYFNAADPRDEWTELLVVTDNTDMRNWSLRDNNSSQTAWQTAVTFNNISFWNNMRAGTIIMIWHRPVTSGSVAHPADVNKDDGYIELDATNTAYLGGGSFGTAPTWAGNSLNIAGGADVLQLRDASGTHIHALGHNSAATGTDWNTLPSPKLNHNNNMSSGDAVYVCPGNVVADYGTSAPQAGTTWTSKNSATITFGLPNISGGNPVTNTAFWDTLREPAFANQIVAPSSVVAGNPGSISFSWAGATDPNAADASTGYIVLRNTSNTFTAPADGTTYTTGAMIGAATIIAQINSSATTSYTDNTVMNGNAYYYRVYAFRYTTDNANGNVFHRSRGRAYTNTFVDVQQTNPLPVELISFTGKISGENILLNWATASELNNDYFIIEKATDEALFSETGRVNGMGNSSQQNSYSFIDESPSAGNNYYRLKQVDFNGAFEYSIIIVIDFTDQAPHTVVTWNTESGINYRVSGWNGKANIEVYDVNGNLLRRRAMNDDEEGIIDLAGEPAGIYIVRFFSGEFIEVKKVKW